MTPVTISPKFQIVIPKDIRESMDLKPGMKCELMRTGGSIRIIPILSIKDLSGICKGMKVDFTRETDREI